MAFAPNQEHYTFNFKLETIRLYQYATSCSVEHRCYCNKQMDELACMCWPSLAPVSKLGYRHAQAKY